MTLPAVQPDPLDRRIPTWLRHLKMTCELETEPRAFVEQLEQLFPLCHFPKPVSDAGKGEPSPGTAFATKVEYVAGNDIFPSSQDKCDLIVNWKKAPAPGVLEIAWICVESDVQYISPKQLREEESWFASRAEFQGYIKRRLRLGEMYRFAALLEQERLYTAKPAAVALGGYILAPGESPDVEKIAAAGFVSKDYSSCAEAEELADLRDGVLPLGQYVFGKSDDKLSHGPRLYLAPHGNGALREYDGVLIVAPINRGKTELLKRWAIAANRAGYSTLLVDVKGNLFAQLRTELKGRVLHFTTDPALPCGDTTVSGNASDRMNLLEGLVWETDVGRKRIEAIVEILLPAAGWRGEGGDAELRYAYRTKYLRAFINILLMEHHYSEGSRAPDLADLYDLANSEARLIRCLRLIAVGEAKARKRGAIPEPGFVWWAGEIAPLISSQLLPTFGQRDPTKAYTDYTLGILAALRPFARDGIFYKKITSEGPGAAFSFDLLDGREQVTLILALRPQDGLESDTLFSVAAKRIEQLLFERFKKEDPRPVLLLLDEAIRLRDFDPSNFIAIAREAKAGCVAVYQSLDPIEEDKRKLLLATVGTQIYLGSLPAGTAKLVSENLPRRTSSVPRISFSDTMQARTRSIAYSGESVPLVGIVELTQLPAWPYSAFVYIRDHRGGKPFIVDLDERPTRVVRVGPSPAAQFASVKAALLGLLEPEMQKYVAATGDEQTSAGFFQRLAARMPARVQIRVESGKYREDVREPSAQELLDRMTGKAKDEYLWVIGNLEIVADDPAKPKPLLPAVRCIGGSISLRGVDLRTLSSASGQRVHIENCMLESIWLEPDEPILARDSDFRYVQGVSARVRIEGGKFGCLHLEGNASAVVVGAKMDSSLSDLAPHFTNHETRVALLDCTGSALFEVGDVAAASLVPGQPSLSMRNCSFDGYIQSWGGRIAIVDSKIEGERDEAGVIDINTHRRPGEPPPAPPATLTIETSEINSWYGRALRAAANTTVNAIDTEFYSYSYWPVELRGAVSRFTGCRLIGGIQAWVVAGAWTFERCYLAFGSRDGAAAYLDKIEQKAIVETDVDVYLAQVFNRALLHGPIEALYGGERYRHYFYIARFSGRRWLIARQRECYQDNRLVARFVALKDDTIVVVSDDGSTMIEVADQMFRRWRIDSNSVQIERLPPECRGNKVVAVSEDGSKVAVGIQSSARLRDSGHWLTIEEPRLREIKTVKFCADKRTLLIGGVGGLSLYDMQQKRIIRRLRTPTAVLAADLRKTGSIAALTEDMSIFLTRPDKTVLVNLKDVARDRQVDADKKQFAAVEEAPGRRPTVTFSEGPYENSPDMAALYPEEAMLVVCGLRSATYVLSADTLKSGVAIPCYCATLADHGNLLIARAERLIDMCLYNNDELDYDYPG
ncbi:MAG: type IV secretory system conjugative DNA transfer family protein [Hyphomicrobiales bacterium]|nr:type IV secretory system conjugative DNA transfer family protein [Hyphomicrobiales bacterium]MBV9426329.1 type IV secretory system conjugative DNA transfer family protein [Bradyrhizobiaceae bacterium]